MFYLRKNGMIYGRKEVYNKDRSERPTRSGVLQDNGGFETKLVNSITLFQRFSRMLRTFLIP